jgi:molybdate transport system substrate-binding protein
MFPMPIRRLAWCLAVAAVMALAPAASTQTPPPGAAADPLRVFASNGVKSVMESLAPEHRTLAGRAVAVTFGTSASIRQAIAAGESFDVAVLTTEALEELQKAGHIAAGSSVAIGRSGLGVGVRSGSARPDVATPDAMKRTLLGATSVTYAADGASRVHLERMFETLRITEAMKAKSVLEQGSVRATARVARGEVEIVLTLVSEILPVAGIELAGPLPAAFQSYVSFSAGVGARARNASAATALVNALSSARVDEVFSVRGIERRSITPP